MKYFNGRTIQGRILRTIMIAIAAVIIISTLSIGAVLRSEDAVRATNKELARNSEHFLKLRISLDQVTSNFDLIAASKGEGALQYLEEIREHKKVFLTTLEDLKKANAQNTWLHSDIQNVRTSYEDVDKIGGETALAYIEGKADVASAKEEGLRNRLTRLREELANLTDKIREFHENDLFEMLGIFYRVLLGVAAGAVILPTLLAWRSTQRISTDLASFVNNLYSHSEENNNTSRALREASEGLASASNEQSAAVQETVASITEIRGMLNQTAAHVKESQQLSESVRTKTSDGSRIMEQMEVSMGAIEASNAQLQQVEEIISGIKEKTQVINDIVFKTQLLSFNASIEAARAGQYGRGFAVVAEEVGNLAQMSGVASKEIDLLLQDSQKKVGQIVESVQEKVKDGKSVANEALDRFKDITSEIVTISEKVNHVGEATLEQEGGIEQTSRAMDQMDKTAEDNKHAADKIYHLAEKGREVSERVRSITEKIHELVSGQSVDHLNDEAEDGIDPNLKTTITPREESNTISLVDRLRKRKVSKFARRHSEQNPDDTSFKKQS